MTTLNWVVTTLNWVPWDQSLRVLVIFGHALTTKRAIPFTTLLPQTSRGSKGVTAVKAATFADTDIRKAQRDFTMTDREGEATDREGEATDREGEATDREGEATHGEARPGTAISTWVKDWAQHGVCTRTAKPDDMFVRGAAQQTAKQVCIGCPVIGQCLADSLDNRTEFGVWGGMTERQRRALLKRRPHVESWRALFETDRMGKDPPAP